jgi:hypothetical protein
MCSKNSDNSLGIYQFSYLSFTSFYKVKLQMLKPPVFWNFLFVKWLNLLDIAAPSTAAASTSSPNISKVKDTRHLVVLCFLLLSCQKEKLFLWYT